jgi:hypothetical protein
MVKEKLEKEIPSKCNKIIINIFSELFLRAVIFLAGVLIFLLFVLNIFLINIFWKVLLFIRIDT